MLSVSCYNYTIINIFLKQVFIVHYKALDIDCIKNMAEVDHASSLEKLREWLNEVE